MEKNWLTFANSYLISQLNYRGQSYITENQNVKQQYHKIRMNIVRWVKQSYCYRISCRKILKSLKWELPNQKMKKRSSKVNAPDHKPKTTKTDHKNIEASKNQKESEDNIEI